MLWTRPKDVCLGMTLATNVPHPCGDADLVKAGVTLDEGLVGRLVELGVEWLPTAFEPLATLDRHLATTTGPAAVDLRAIARETYERVAVDGQRELPFGRVYAAVRDALAHINGLGGRGLYYDPVPRDADDLAGHAAAVAVLSMLLGARLERYVMKQRRRLPPEHARELVNLGVGAVFHDIGKTRLDATLRKFHVARPPGDTAARGEWQSHPRLGYELVKEGVEASAASAVLHHHQHFDGSGFPRVMVNGKRVSWAGVRLHVFSRILAVANAFDRLSWCKETGGRLTNLQTLWRVRQLPSGRLDGVVVKALHEVCPPFPPGSRVVLDDGTAAVVVQLNEADVFRPVVRRIAPPPEGSSVPVLVGDAVDLRIDPSRRIVRSEGVATQGLLTDQDTLERLGAWEREDADDRDECPALTGEEAERAYRAGPRFATVRGRVSTSSMAPVGLEPTRFMGGGF